MIVCPNCGSRDTLPDAGASQNTRACLKCNARFHDENNYSGPESGSYNTQGRRPRGYNHKSERATLVLAVVLGLFGLSGIGHIYLGKLQRGLCILVGSFLLAVVGVATIPLFVGIVLLIVAFIIFIWHIFNARNLCRQYNDQLARTGAPPW